MRKIIFAYYLMVILVFSTTAVLTAESYRNDSGSIYIAAEDENSSLLEPGHYDKDYFWGGASMNFTGSADDLYLMGRTIDFSGKSNGALTIFGDTITIDGLVSRNLHTAGNDIRLSGNMEDTAFVAGQDITVSKGAVIDGTLISASNTLQVLGQLNDGLLAGAGEIIIDGPVVGDVNVRTGKLIITERGSIDGDLIYGSNTKISEKEKDRVTGTVTFEEKEQIDKKRISTFCIVVATLFFLGLCAAGLIYLLLPGIRSKIEVDRDPASYGKTLLWGLIPLFIYPVAVLVTIPLWPVALALALAAFPLWMVAIITGLTLAGQLLFKLFKWDDKHRMLHFLFAFAIYALLFFVPVLGVLVGLAIAALGAGLIVGRIFNTTF